MLYPVLVHKTQTGLVTNEDPGTQNQTQMALANLTRADMEPVTSALNSARDSLLGKDSGRIHVSQ